MSFPGHSCPSNMIICSQPQTRGEGEGGRGRRRGCGNDVHRKTSPILMAICTYFT